MDRVSAANYALVSGKRMYQDTNLVAGITGTEFAQLWYNGVQESIIEPVEAVGLTPTDADNTQLFKVMQRLAGSSITTVTGSTTLTAATAGMVLINASSGNLTITLPAAAATAGVLASVAQANPVRLTLVRVDSSANTVTVQCSGTDTLACSASTSFGLSGGMSRRLISDGAGAYYSDRAISPSVFEAVNYTMQPGQIGGLINATAVGTTITLLPAGCLALGDEVTIFSQSGSTTINTNGSNVIRLNYVGSATLSLPSVGDFVKLRWSGVAWNLVAGSAVVLGVPFVAPLSSESSIGVGIGTGYSGVQTVSFTAPGAGHVMAFGKLNVSNTPSAAITTSLAINGSSVSGDACAAAQSHFGVLAVSDGEAVSVTMTVTTTTSPGVAGTYSAAALFIPA